jgi:virginiamycin B lyase
MDSRRAGPWHVGLGALALAVAACGPGQATSGPAASPSAAVGAVTGPPARSYVPLATHDGPSPTATAASSQPASSLASTDRLSIRELPVPAGSHPHDVSPAADGGIWYTAQASGKLGHLDPTTGAIREIVLGPGSAPHGVITGPDDAPWITDAGLNAIVRVDPATGVVRRFPLPPERARANLNTAVFDRAGSLWFTGQAGVYGRLDPATGALRVFDAPRGRGPYGITATPDGTVWYASLAGNHIARVDPATGAAATVQPPTPGQGARRVWSDSQGRVWVSEWSAGQVAVLTPATGSWREWRLPGERPSAYAVFVDDRDVIWLTDFGGNAIVRFDPSTETFSSVALPSPNGSVRQLHGRPGQILGAESAVDRLVIVTGG